MTSLVDADPPLATAAEAARILGVTRSRMLMLASSAPDFSTAQHLATGGRVWLRAAIEAWAAAHPDRGPLHPGLEIPPIGEWPWQVQTVVDLAHEEARALHHDWVDQDHLLLALLHPDCPGTARAVLESFGVIAAPLRAAWVASIGDPYEPHHRGILFATGQPVLERANLEALALADAEVASEHVLLALTAAWDRSFAAHWLQRRGVDPATLRQRVVDYTEGGELPTPPPAADEPAWGAERDVAPGLALAPTPAGKDPRRRRPWGSAVFADAEGRTFQRGLALRQYFIDRDGNPVLTVDGRPVHLVQDADGQTIVGPVEVPPGCEVVEHRGRS